MNTFNRMLITAFLSVVALVLLAPLPLTVKAAAQEDSWQEIAQARLKKIYQQGFFRGNQVETAWLEGGHCLVRSRGSKGSETIYRIDPEKGTKTPNAFWKPPKRPDSRNSPDGKYRIEFPQKQLAIRRIGDKQLTRLTNHPEARDISYRRASWSADSKYILFTEADSTDIRIRSMITKSDPSYPKVREMKFARVGEKITQLRVGIANVESGQIKWLKIDAPEEGIYLGQVEWAGNSNEVLVEKMSRFRDRREFLLFDIINDKVSTLFSESSDTWAVSSRSINTGLHWVDGGKSFIVISEQEAWRRAFLFSRNGKKLRSLNPEDYDLIEHGFVDDQTQQYYFYASPNNATEKFLYRVSFGKDELPTRVTPDHLTGTHEYKFSPDGRWAIHSFSTYDSPPSVDLVSMPNHETIKTLDKNLSLKKKVAELERPPTEFFQLKISDKVSIDGWMLKPSHFDASKKYPVLVYVYGEPYAQTVLNRWGAAQADYHRLVADLGYVVVSFDNRGTPAPKGVAWRNAVFGSLGPLSTEEQAAAVTQLGKTYSFVDLKRVGIWGWSGGGSNTLNAMFRKPDIYRVGIAVVPKPQPHLYNAWFQEIYMRTREVNPNGYEKSAPINFATGLKGKLLIVTGSGETNTHIQIIEGLVDRLIELGKPFDYMVYPHRNHGLREGRGTSVHLRMLMLRYLEDHLKPQSK